MKDRISVFEWSTLPQPFGVILLVLALIFLLSPYFSGADFGVFKIPNFTTPAKKWLKVIGPILFCLCVISFLPIIRKTSNQPVVPTTASPTPAGNCLEAEFAKADLIDVGTPPQPLRAMDRVIRIKLMDGQQTVAGMRLRFVPAASPYFIIEEAVDSKCLPIEGLLDTTRGTYVNKDDKVADNDYLQIPFSGKNYSLRLMAQGGAFSALWQKVP